MKEWILINCDFREHLPKEDCEIWITRLNCLGERWVQKVDYYAETKDIAWDGTIAFMVAGNDEKAPLPCNEKYVELIQNVR